MNMTLGMNLTQSELGSILHFKIFCDSGKTVGGELVASINWYRIPYNVCVREMCMEIRIGIFIQ